MEREFGKLILKEVRASTAHLKISLYDEDNPNDVGDEEDKVDGGGGGVDQPGSIIDHVKKLLDRKLDKLEFAEDMRTKANKKDLEMSLQTIDTMHR